MERRMLYWYKHELEKSVKISWQLELACPAVGLLPLFPIMFLTQRMIQKLMLHLVLVDLEVSNPDDLRLNQVYPFVCSLTNTTQDPIQVELSLFPVQDLQNGTSITNLQTQLGWLGPLNREIRLETKWKEEFNMIFFCSGSYQFQVSAKRKDSSEILFAKTFAYVCQ